VEKTTPENSNVQTYTLKPRDCYRNWDINIHCEEDNAIMKLFTNYNTKEMGLAVPDQDLQTNSLPLYREAAPGDRVPVNPMHFM
jgi:hypothetical protein